MGDMGLKAVVYIRVSTEEQKPENQQLVLDGFARGRGIEVVGWFVDLGVSGYETRPEERDGWRRAVEAAKKSDAAILVFSLDRIARRYDYLINTLESLRRDGIQLISYQEEWLQSLASIPDEALRKLMFDIIVRALAYAYQKYVDALRDKIKAGMERARRTGKQIGRPPAIPEEYIAKLLLKYPGLSKKALWKIALGDGYKISYPRFTKKVNEVARKYGIQLKKEVAPTTRQQ